VNLITSAKESPAEAGQVRIGRLGCSTGVPAAPYPGTIHRASRCGGRLIAKPADAKARRRAAGAEKA